MGFDGYDDEGQVDGGEYGIGDKLKMVGMMMWVRWVLRMGRW